MSPNIVALLYLAAGVLFILALRGLSSPESSRQGNIYGMIGMTIAVVTTLMQIDTPDSAVTWLLIIAGLGIGGGIGAVIAQRIPMTAMPELVAAFHSLVGMAAVFVAAAALNAPEAFGIGSPGTISPISLFEMSLGTAIGAITFTGSVIAFAKLSGRMSGAPIILPMRHVINIAIAVALVLLVFAFCFSGDHWSFWLITIPGAGTWHPDHHPHWRRRHAGGRLDAELLLGLGRGWHRLHARQHRADHHRRAGRLVGCDPVLHHVQGHEPLVHLGDPRRLRRRDVSARPPTTASSARSSRAPPTMPATS